MVSSSERAISAKSPRCRPSTSAPRFAHCRMASASGTVSPSSARAIAVSISRSGCTTTAVSPAGTGSRTMSGGLGWRTSTKPPQSAGAMLSACAATGAEAFAFERARDQRLDRRMRLEQRVDGHDRGRGAGRAAAQAARERQPFANRLSATPRRSPSAVEQRLRRDAGRVPRRLARQPAVVAGDVVDADAGRRERARSLRRPAPPAQSRARRSRTRRSTRSPAQTRSRDR